MNARCKCGKCELMPLAEECVCCKEIEQVCGKMDEIGEDINCITEHEGFTAVCLNLWVIQTSYFQYRQRYGNVDKPVHE